MSVNRFRRIEQMDESKRLERNSLFVAITATLVALVVSIAAFILKFSNPWTIFPIFIVGLISIWLILTKRYIVGNWLMISISIIATVVEVMLRSGEGFNRGIIGMVFIGGYGLAAMPRHLRGRMLLFGFIVGVGIITLDFVGPAERTPSPQTSERLAVTILSVLVFSFFIAREFLSLDLRAKITLGILGTGGIALGVLTFFALDRAGTLVDTLSTRLETTVALLAEEQLVNRVETEAGSVNNFFDDLSTQTRQLSNYFVSLNNEQSFLGAGTYWDSHNELTPLGEGQYGNSAKDTASVFVPSNVGLNEAAYQRMNIAAYLDFAVPQVLEEDTSLLAVFYIDRIGFVRYYPNIGLANVLPHDFDATKRPYFQINTPLFNPQRVTRWTIPYEDATGGGLVVTVANPVYISNIFRGVLAADVQLSTLANQVADITVGQNGYAILLDDAGRVIYMPKAGYDLFGIDQTSFSSVDFEKQTILGHGTDELRSVTNRMVAGGNGLNTYTVNGIEYYLAFTRIQANGYSLAIVVPVAEMQTAIELTRNETANQTSSTIRTAAFILIILLAGAVVISFGLGQVIAQPVLQLTKTANQILEGDLTAQTTVTSRDEIGTLAQAFNAMTARLRETLSGLEKTVDDRTTELVKANEDNQRRAKQFQSIAQVARTISSTLDLDSLLTQITNVISREFNFYHVGIFLLDPTKQYAVLSAANSEGGQKMLENGHKLKVGEKGLVGFVSSTGRPRVALDTGVDAVFFNNPYLPETRSEISLPLRAGEEIVGVLDVQSNESNAFSREDVSILSTLADQVSIAIQNARQNEETSRLLSESEALSRQFVQTGWSQFTKRQNILGLRHTGAKANLIYEEKSDNGKGDTQRLRGKGKIVSLPIKLRGEVIGTVDIRSADNRQWDQDEMDIITAIIERAAIAMENSRLINDAQRRAAREQAISEMAANIGTYTETEAILRSTVNEIGKKIGGARVVFEFNPQDDKRSKSK